MLFGKILCHVGVDEARCDAVDSDAPRTDFPRERHRHADQTGLGGRIVHLTGIAHRPHDRGHGNDAARALLHHRANTGARQAEGCGQIGFNHRLPLLVLHAHDETVLGNAGIIDEHINAAVFGHDVVDGLLRSFSITDIEHNAAAAAFKGFAGLVERSRARFRSGRANNHGTRLKKSFKDRTANTAARTGNKTNLPGERVRRKDHFFHVVSQSKVKIQ